MAIAQVSYSVTCTYKLCNFLLLIYSTCKADIAFHHVNCFFHVFMLLLDKQVLNMKVVAFTNLFLVVCAVYLILKISSYHRFIKYNYFLVKIKTFCFFTFKSLQPTWSLYLCQVFLLVVKRESTLPPILIIKHHLWNSFSFSLLIYNTASVMHLLNHAKAAPFTAFLVCFTVYCCCCLVAKLCPTLWDPMDCSPPGSSVHGISQARILECIAISFSRGSSQPSDQTHVSCIGMQISPLIFRPSSNKRQ